ncbi:MAG: 30S ribosomal protein S13 [Candidatus Methanofastidiosia archaeon]
MMSEFKGIVRMFGTDLDGEKKVYIALTKLKGVSTMMARAVTERADIDKNSKLGNLSDEKIAEIEKILKNPREHDIPSWLFNRRRDYETGKALHNVGAKLLMSLREDLNRLKKIRAYRGIRHELGLPVRGQKTKSSFRIGRAVGVSRKKARAK